MNPNFMEIGTKYMLATRTIILAFDTEEERDKYAEKYRRDSRVYQYYTLTTKRQK